MGQTEAIQLVRNTVKTTMTTPTVATNSSTTQPSEGVTEPNMTDTSRVPPMVFIDDEGHDGSHGHVAQRRIPGFPSLG